MKIAIIGDVHDAWGASDVHWFNRAAYDRILFVGDLSEYRQSRTLRVVRQIAALETPTLVMPGNHDAVHIVQMIGVIIGQPWIGRPFVGGNQRKLDALIAALRPHTLAAWSAHPLDEDTAILAGRPHSAGGPTMSFAGYLDARWGVANMNAAAQRLRALVDTAPERIVFLAHNGPTGLGARRDDIWGCDFRREAGDWGDPDLRAGIDYAKETGRNVLAVVAGHMHLAVKRGGERPWQVEQDGTLYINAARVPRIRDDQHHHVCLTIDGEQVSAEEHFVRPG